ncbi:MAG: thiamine phosphate synthase [Rhodocyclales bacterium]|nr:thiamine phosphate synthase [Rhodocyclales bacterium]
MTPELRGLYAITPEATDEPRLLADARAALAGGARLLQFRDKTTDTGRRRRLATALHTLCREHGARFIVNDDLELALAVAADGVHLGADDGDLAAARRALPAGRLLGASCYADFEAARRAVAAGADYVAFGAVCPSPTKPNAVRAPLDLFARCRTELGIPACAIGGITLATAPGIIAAGAAMLAVITDLFAAPDIAGQAAAYQHLFEESRHDFA